METKKCAACKRTLPISEFYRYRPTKGGSPMRVCKECHKVRCEEKRQTLPKEKRSEINRRQRVNNLDGRKAAEKRWAVKRRSEGWFSDPERRRAFNQTHKFHRDRRKAETFQAYGSSCACCGEDDLRLLTLDHLNNDGAEERRRIGYRGSTQRIYARLKREGYPSGYQVLCFTCNAGRYIAKSDKCPHQLEALKIWQSILTYVTTKEIAA